MARRSRFVRPSKHIGRFALLSSRCGRPSSCYPGRRLANPFAAAAGLRFLRLEGGQAPSGLLPRLQPGRKHRRNVPDRPLPADANSGSTAKQVMCPGGRHHVRTPSLFSLDPFPAGLPYRQRGQLPRVPAGGGAHAVAPRHRRNGSGFVNPRRGQRLGYPGAGHSRRKVTPPADHGIPEPVLRTVSLASNGARRNTETTSSRTSRRCWPNAMMLVAPRVRRVASGPAGSVKDLLVCIHGRRDFCCGSMGAGAGCRLGQSGASRGGPGVAHQPHRWAPICPQRDRPSRRHPLGLCRPGAG